LALEERIGSTRTPTAPEPPEKEIGETEGRSMPNGDQPSRRVIVVGASPRRWRYGNKAVRAYREAGYDVYPVHPTEPRIEGIPAFASIGEVPVLAELLLLYVRPEIGSALIGEALGRGVSRVYVNPGSGSPELVAKIRELGMEPIEACAIVALGKIPAQYPD
jgi:predicted CoA-binding protein